MMVRKLTKKVHFITIFGFIIDTNTQNNIDNANMHATVESETSDESCLPNN